MAESRKDVDLSLIGRQSREIITEVGVLRDDMAVLLAAVFRLDKSLTALLREVRDGA